jgi:NADH-quinone oxidoreductase subunit N
MNYGLSGTDVLVMTPLSIITGFALLVLVLDLFLRPEQRGALVWTSLLGVLAALVADVAIPAQSGTWVQGMLRFDEISKFLNVVFLLGAGVAIMLSGEYTARQGIARGEYYCLLLFSTLGAMLMGMSADLIMLFLALETLSIPLYVLSTFFKQQPASQEAGLKYFLLGAFSSALFLYGIALVYGATGTTGLAGVFAALPEALTRAPGMLYAGLGLLIVGLGFKAAAVPFHTWAPDVYEGAPTSVTAFMAVAAKAGAFAAFLRVLSLAFPQPELAANWAPLVGLLAILTMVLGNVVAVVQLNLKRLLAYSSIAHAGYLLVALVAMQNSATAAAATSSLLFYLFIYTLMTLGAFGVVIVAEGRGENLSLSDLSGLAARHPWLAGMLAVFMVSLAGLPPTAGFFAKFYVFKAAIESGQLGVWLTIIGVLTSVISVYYYLRVVYYAAIRPAEVERPLYLSPLAFTSLALAALLVLLLGIYPAAVLAWATPVLMGMP